jgi:predicted dienelactone hydrolase
MPVVIARLVAVAAFLASAAPLCAQVSPPQYRAGYEVLRIDDLGRSRPIQLDIWYPASAAAEGEHRYGLGTGRVALGAAIAPGRFPAILLSHGALGAATNYAWIAEHLARSGFLVVGVSHFGESPVFGPDTIDPTTVTRFGARTRDFSAALDFVMLRSKYAPFVDSTRVGALGHSSGGATVAMLAGGRYRPEGMAAHCGSASAQGDRGCRYPAGQPPARSASEMPTADPRVRLIVLLDPAVGPGFDRASLAEVVLPALVIGSTDNDFLPFASHAGRYAALLPRAELLRLDRGEGHFVYIDECSVPAEAMGVPLCTDRPGVNRGDVHERLAARIGDYLTAHLAATPSQ